MNVNGLILLLIVVAAFLPLASSLLNIFFSKKKFPSESSYWAAGAMFASFAACLFALILWLPSDREPIHRIVKWLPIANDRWLTLGVFIDSLTIAMMSMVSLISFLVHIYSIGYMKGDSRYPRFFIYLSLFTFSMFGIVLSNSIMQLFVFWELVGLTSYLLIGFWHEKKGPQLASKKAFVMNRVGDMGFLVGFGILFSQLKGNVYLPATEGVDGTVSMFKDLNVLLSSTDQGSITENPPLWLTIAGIGLFLGAMGKSAQFPLQTWLPDAMEGPTPVSSIVHSATMVAAGVYMTARIYPILTPDAHLFIATIGLITLVGAALMALVMTDIKRVLAYSTLSQLGYMVLALGCGAYHYALFHLLTHAFFKCCLFQCSGSVIHAAHHQQDMRYYGGLGKKMPKTMLCYGLCTLAIAGASIPFTTMGLSGFYSKDGIIAGTIAYSESMEGLGSWAKLFWLGPVTVAFITPFYMARSFALTFLGKPRDKHLYDHAHEAPAAMVLPQLVLAVFAVAAGWHWLMPFDGLVGDTHNEMIALMGGAESSWVLTPQDLGKDSHPVHLMHAYLLHGFGWIAAIGLGVLMYMNGFGVANLIVKIPGINLLYRLIYNKFYFDVLYDIIIVNLFSVILSNLIAGIDKIVDWFLTGLPAAISKGFSGLIRAIDEKVVDGMVNTTAAITQSMGGILRVTQAGRVRSYVMILFGCVTVIMLLVVVTAVILQP